MSPYRLVSIAGVIGALAACSPGDGYNVVPDTGEDDGDLDTAAEADDTDDDTDVEIAPSLFSLDASLTITSGAIEPASVTVDVAFWTTATGTPTALCARAPLVVDATEAPIVDDVPLWGWWELSLQADDADGCSWEIPTPIRFGIGELDARLYPAMEAHDFDTTTTAPYGAYVAYGDEAAPVFVYGVAGTAPVLDGDEAAATTGPLPDGSYRLVGLHLLPLPE